MFLRRAFDEPSKILKLNEHWRLGEELRVSARPFSYVGAEPRRMVIRRRGIGELALVPMSWGLAPSWEQRPLISVRAETVRDEREWRRLLNTQRCLVPADRFFEWSRHNGHRTREYAFRLKSRQPMMLAGLWDAPPRRGLECFAYISCPANRLVGLVHDRMPVVLAGSALKTWLDPDAPVEALLHLLRPCEGDLLDAAWVAPAQRQAAPEQLSLFTKRAA